MDKPKTVKVIAYRVLDSQAGDMLLSRHKAVRDHITRVGGEVIEGTEEDVPSGDLDELGRWRRVATGWGELR